MNFKKSLLVTLISFTLSPLHAQMMDMGGGYGGFGGDIGGIGLGNIDLGTVDRVPNIQVPQWNNPNVPDFIEEEEFGGNDIPDTLDLISGGQENLGGEQLELGETPTGLSLPDPDDVDTDDIVFPFPNVVVGVPPEVLADIEVLPISDLATPPSEVVDCGALPPYSAFEYASHLDQKDLEAQDYIEMHTLWVKNRICKDGGSIDSDTSVRILNDQDPRCVYYTGENYKRDLALAETAEEKDLITDLYQRYFFICF